MGKAILIICGVSIIYSHCSPAATGDQIIPGLWTSYKLGRTGVQLGDNKQPTDWTYVTNAADAHILAADKLSTDTNPPVAGEIFFITNDDPMPFWTFVNGIWDRLDKIYPGKRIKKKPLVIPRTLASVFAFISESIAWITGKPTSFTKFNVIFICTTRWHNIEKAKKVLGYKPKVSMEEALDLYVDVCVIFSYQQLIPYYENFLVVGESARGGGTTNSQRCD